MPTNWVFIGATFTTMRRYLTRFLNPPEFPDEEQTRVATLLNFFIWAVIAIISLNAIALFFAAPEIGFTLWLNGLVVALAFGLRWLMWQGRVNLAGFLLCLVFWGALAYYLATSGGLRSPALVDLGVTVVMATILLGGRGAFVFGVISGITLLALYMGDVAGWLISREAAPTESRLLASYLSFIGGMAVFAMIGAYSVSHALAHSRQSKHQLATQNQALQREAAERKRAEQAHRQSEERFAKAFQVSPVGIVIVKLADAQIVDANNSFLRLLGYSRDEIIGHKATELSLLASAMAEHEISRALLTNQSIRDLEINFRTKSGEVRIALASLELVELDREPCVLALIDDITERIKAEEALRTSEARFRLLFENSPVGIAIVRNQNCLFANQTLGALFGTADSTELISHPFCDHVAPDHRQEILRKLDDNAETLPISLDTYGLRQDGAHFRMHLYIGVIPLADGPAFIVFVVDLTDRIRLEEETLKAVALRVELDKEREVVELKDRFTSMVSHEFRTPLTVIRMSSELLEHFPGRFSEERKVKFLQDMQTQVRYMVQLLEDVLTIGKANAGRLAFNPRPVDARTFSQSLLEQLQLADSDQHRFVFLADGNLDPIHLDEQILRHILVNLLSNAIKYSPAGTEVSLGVVREADEVIFRISDQGIGIPEADRPHLFEAFHRGKNTAKVQGTGLGLAIVKANVETHGGTIFCESQVGVGTTFTVRLPVNPPAAWSA